jgi:hypothetical protein
VLTHLVSLSQLWFGDAGFEVGEAVVLAGGGQFVGEASGLGFLIAHGAFEGEVLTGHADPVVFGPAGIQVADLAEEFGDVLALAQDLGVRCLECVLAVERPLAPGSLQRLLFGLTAFGSSSGGLCGSCLDDAPGLSVSYKNVRRPRRSAVLSLTIRSTVSRTRCMRACRVASRGVESSRAHQRPDLPAIHALRDGRRS